MFLGDLFDSYEAPVWDVLQVYSILAKWKANHPDNYLYLVAGNHDLSKTSNVLGSFDMLAALLEDRFFDTVQVVKEPLDSAYGYIIPHLPNQAAFDAALAKVPERKFLFLHCNYDNNFAAQSDQSLNITKEQVDALPVQQVIIAHEHQVKSVGKVLLPGNQIATSISDWQGCTAKFKVVVVADEAASLVKVASRDEQYVEHLWTDPQVTDHKFVRLVGAATAEQAPDVVNAVARFRASSPALVVGNGVQIATADGLGDFAASLESVQAFDVWSALSDVLETAEIETLKGLE